MEANSMLYTLFSSGFGMTLCNGWRRIVVCAHGITLSRQQYEFTEAKIRHLELEKQVNG
jgi:cyclopropane fatty-acyl-phospholipid synthase-like methyltransferase